MKKKKCCDSSVSAKNVDRLKERLPQIQKKIPMIAEEITTGILRESSLKHIGCEKIPSKESIIEIINDIEKILFPGYFGEQDITDNSLEHYIGYLLFKLYEKLSEQISKSFRHKCASNHYKMCIDCYNKGIESAYAFIAELKFLREILALDIQAAFEGDPAAKCYDEIIFSYPGFKAIFIYRIANTLHKMGVPLIPRTMTEYAHSLTGIDIHPGASIGKHFFIDHGTGVVIGETSQIGNNVKIYQGVTLGALSIPKKKATDYVSDKRHPTICDDCVIYAGATILGGETIVGKGSIVGGNVWLIKSVPPGSKIMSQQQDLNYFCNPQASIPGKK